jgi:hypothetical protein
MKISDYAPDATNVQRRGRFAPTERLIILTLATVRRMATAERIHDLTQVPKFHVRKVLNRLVDRVVVDRVDVATSIAGDEEVALFQLAGEQRSVGYPHAESLHKSRSYVLPSPLRSSHVPKLGSRRIRVHRSGTGW